MNKDIVERYWTEIHCEVIANRLGVKCPKRCPETHRISFGKCPLNCVGVLAEVGDILLEWQREYEAKPVKDELISVIDLLNTINEHVDEGLTAADIVKMIGDAEPVELVR